MKRHLHAAFWKGWSGKLWSFICFAALAAPSLTPVEMQAWVASLIPWAHAWVSQALGTGILLVRVYLAWSKKP